MASTPNDPLALAAGDLCHVVTFLQRTTTTDASGAVVAYTSYATTRAKIEPLRGIELLKAGQDVSQLFLTVTIRYRNDIDSTMRIQTASGSVYIVQNIENLLERNRVMRLTCEGIGANS